MNDSADAIRGKAVERFILENEMAILHFIFDSRKKEPIIMGGKYFGTRNKRHYDGTLGVNSGNKYLAGRFDFKMTKYSDSDFDNTFIISPSCHQALYEVPGSMLVLYYEKNMKIKIIHHRSCPVVSNDEIVNENKIVRLKITEESIFAEEIYVLPAEFDISQYEVHNWS